MPKPVSPPAPLLVTTHRLPVFAWNATANCPSDSLATAGLVPLIMPSPQSFGPALPVVQRLPVFAWNASAPVAFSPPPPPTSGLGSVSGLGLGLGSAPIFAFSAGDSAHF